MSDASKPPGDPPSDPWKKPGKSRPARKSDPETIKRELQELQQSVPDYQGAGVFDYIKSAVLPLCFAAVAIVVMAVNLDANANYRVYYGKLVPGSFINGPGELFSKQDEEVRSQDYVINIPSGQTSIEAQIWDYAAEDGDSVVILKGDEEFGTTLELTNEPINITLETDANLRIVGARDNGDSINYAIYFPILDRFVLNTVYVDSINHYQLLTGDNR